MKQIHPLLAAFVLAVAFPWLGRGQLTVDVELGQEQYISNESLLTRVRVTNRSGQTLTLGENPGWLSFTVTKQDGKLATRLGPVPVRGEFSLLSSQSRDRVFDLMPYYNLQPGRYDLMATVSIPEWGSRFNSKEETFEVVKGVKIWEQTVGIPQPESDTSLPELRRYVLLQARYLKNMYLYARVTGKVDSEVYRVVPLGEVVNFVPVEHLTDRESRLHVLFQDGPRSFNYTVVDPNGKLVKRQRHDYYNSRPALKADEDGRVLVVGGIRRLAPTDYPGNPPAGNGNTNEVEEPSL